MKIRKQALVTIIFIGEKLIITQKIENSRARYSGKLENTIFL